MMPAGGKKYEYVEGKKVQIPRLEVADQDPDKVQAAEIFAASLKVINEDKTYLRLKEKHQLDYESKGLNLEGIQVIQGVPVKRGGEAKGEIGKRALKQQQQQQKKGQGKVSQGPKNVKKKDKLV